MEGWINKVRLTFETIQIRKTGLSQKSFNDFEIAPLFINN